MVLLWQRDAYADRHTAGVALLRHVYLQGAVWALQWRLHSCQTDQTQSQILPLFCALSISAPLLLLVIIQATTYIHTYTHTRWL